MAVHDDFPGVVVSSDEDALTPSPPEHVYSHLDSYEEVDITPPDAKKLHIYTFGGEEREGELLDTINDLRQEFIFATGAIWPDWMDGEVEDFSTEVLNGLEWVTASGEQPKPDHVETIREYL